MIRGLEIRGKDWLQIAPPDLNALCWRTTSAGRGPYIIQGEFEILEGTAAQAPQINLLLGRGTYGFVSVAFTSRYGVDAFRYHAEGNRWENLGSSKVPGVEAGRRIPLKVVISGGRLAVSVEGKEVLGVPLPERPMDGPWGVGVQAGSAGIWHEFGIRQEKE